MDREHPFVKERGRDNDDPVLLMAWNSINTKWSRDNMESHDALKCASET